MYRREIYLKKITTIFSKIKFEVSERNSLHLYDINIHSENFFQGLLNKIFDYKLENLNTGNILTEAIDLGDAINGIAVQVTSNRSMKKITDTVQKFYDNESYKEYPTLKILIIGSKPNRRQVIPYEKFIFDCKKDIIDSTYLLNAIQKLETEKIKEISEWMESEIHQQTDTLHTPPSKLDFDRYFQKFLNPDMDANRLLAKAQPNIADCKEVFADEHYLIVYQVYSMFYFSMIENGNVVNDKLRDKDLFRVNSSTFSEVEKGEHKLPGGMTEIIKRGALRPGKLSYHTISFTQADSELGVSFKVWVFLNGRWVYFPRPWEIIRGISDLRSYKPMNFLIRALRLFGLKDLGLKDQAGVLTTIYILSELGKKK